MDATYSRIFVLGNVATRQKQCSEDVILDPQVHNDGQKVVPPKLLHAFASMHIQTGSEPHPQGSP